MKLEKVKIPDSLEILNLGNYKKISYLEEVLNRQIESYTSTDEFLFRISLSEGVIKLYRRSPFKGSYKLKLVAIYDCSYKTRHNFWKFWVFSVERFSIDPKFYDFLVELKLVWKTFVPQLKVKRKNSLNIDSKD